MTGLHWSKQYDQDLETIKSKALLMGGLAEEQLANAIHALQEGDVELAEKVMATDEQVNQLQVSLDNACTELIVRRQPAAGDLRTVIATMRVITDVERIADEATKVARAAKNLQTRNLLLLNQYQPIHAIAGTAQQMLRDALDAYARLDRDKAVRMMALDEDLDREFHDMMRSLITYMMEEPKTISASLDILWAAKAIERIGDHATNIGEYVIYIVDGDDIRHSDYARKVLGIVK
ncbi:phosphate signaling complex protein PhoU [Oxalobacter vibrioformis]|uniref:Phosphate-specific transport system accessory protein PhoU n=1 Tax=Oxalobacter vibrioformis TaxID=933080 RepID=A0A9E9LTZ4_9BURK|nr:phosphate signaling complex protein PhoU [Oxalobacter vibrioformis]WAW09590.1 phosphate signaling complex protein PhoU [Oxalobacter vibrioformis]